MEIYIGCSGFHYKTWRKKFYPEKMPVKDWLAYYSEHFNTVEINNTFYKMPEEKSFRGWMEKTPSHFKLTIKANRFFTHQKKLNADDDFRESFEGFSNVVKTLGSKLGCVLWQLPGNLHKNEKKLSNFLKLLVGPSHHVIEFRHESWFTDSVYSLLKEHNTGFCMLSAPGNLPEVVKTTSSIAYLRFHGKSSWYNYRYSEEEIKSWYLRLQNMKEAEQLYVYFNNDYNAWAVENAKMLDSMFS